MSVYIHIKQLSDFSLQAKEADKKYINDNLVFQFDWNIGILINTSRMNIIMHMTLAHIYINDWLTWYNRGLLFLLSN